MRVEITEQTGIRHDGAYFSFGDVVTVPDAVGAYFCGLGWAKDVEGKVATGDRNTSNVVICPENARHLHVGEDVSG